eukprot:TRINITY_DN24933_c0_g1_i3.p1 TRINITY_DN24933_c0_g1~~TRINITY_DN24933_c0_g1_i3.p1  ORF type:complete len:194 (-),score=17.13 TRINITY_DN24933_c0_g1_i3:242-745(-)
MMGIVPTIYQCSHSHEVMSDPVILLESGQLFDKGSVQSLPEDDVKNKHIVPLPDLKQAIQQYLALSSINLPEESQEKTNQTDEVQSQESGAAAGIFQCGEKIYKSKEKSKCLRKTGGILKVFGAKICNKIKDQFCYLIITTMYRYTSNAAALLNLENFSVYFKLFGG